MGDDPPKDVTLSAELTASGVSVAATSRAISSFDHLLGTALDLAREPLEGVLSRAKARNSIREAAIRAEGQLALDALASMPGLGQRAVQRLIDRELRGQANVEAIVQGAAETLKILPPKPVEDAAEVELDWLNIFGQYAQEASSDRLQQIWSRVLAGEIREPGAFSFRTLAFISQLDKQTAASFQKFAKFRFHKNKFLPAVKYQGAELLEFRSLEEVGLVHSTDSLSMPVKAIPSPTGGPVAGYCFWSEGKFGLKMKVKKEPLQIKFRQITRVGVEICGILEPSDPRETLRTLYSTIESQCLSAEIVNFDKNSSEIFHTLEILKMTES